MNEERVEYRAPVVIVRNGKAEIEWEDRYLILRQ